MEAASPMISAVPEMESIEERLESFNLAALKPRVTSLPDTIKVIQTISPLPDPKDASPMLP